MEGRGARPRAVRPGVSPVAEENDGRRGSGARGTRQTTNIWIAQAR